MTESRSRQNETRMGKTMDSEKNKYLRKWEVKVIKVYGQKERDKRLRKCIDGFTGIKTIHSRLLEK